MSSGQIDLTTGEVVEQAPVEGTVVPYGQGPERRQGDVGLAQYLTDREGPEGEAPEELAYRAIVEQILASETVRDVLLPIEAINATEELDRPFDLDGLDWRESDFEQGAPMYAVMRVKFADNGERMVLTTGNQAVLAQLISLQTKHDAAHRAYMEWEAKGSKGRAPTPVFPLPSKLVEIGKPNKYGNRPVRLVLPDWEPKVRKPRATG